MRLKIISLVIVVLSGLSACSTTENVPKKSQNINNQRSQTLPSHFDAQGLYEKALSEQGANRIQLLYSARDMAINEQNWRTLENVCLALESKATVDHVQNQLYIALARKHLGNYSDALTLLDDLYEKLTLPDHKAWHRYLIGSILASEELPKKALAFYFQAADIVAKHKLQIAGLNNETWSTLQQLSSFALERFDRGSVIQQGWVKLAKYQQVYLGSDVELHQAINNWQRRFINHPAHSILPDDMRSTYSLAPHLTKRLAILIPQSGNNQRLGTALKNGILAALDKVKIDEVFFIDEASSIDDIDEALLTHQADFVIGPLLRSNIERLQKSTVLNDLPAIYLNAPQQKHVESSHYYFSLNTEHEVTQALTHFLANDYQKPMLLAPKGNAGQRFVSYFIEQWQKYSEIKPEVGMYSDSKDMAKVITHLLEVDASKQRIQLIGNLFEEKIKSETRSRTDFDVIYILGDSTDTRLLKPYLDVNVSTFAKKIPLYASSRSFTRNITKTDQKDLEGLYFTEQLWMLPNFVKNQNLRDDYDSLWPEQSDIEQRLFAMAYDAVNIIPVIKQLSRIPGKEYTGLTGVLSIKANNTLQRRLSWAQYHKGNIRLVKLNESSPIPLFMQNSKQKLSLN